MIKDWRALAIAMLLAFAPSPATANGVADALVLHLGHPRSSERTRAFRELERLGPAALPAVTHGCQSPTFEVRTRCRQLRDKLNLTDAERLEIDFLAGRETSKAGFWSEWKKLAPRLGGNVPEARSFFLHLYKADAKFVKSLPSDANKLAEIHQKTLSKLQQNLVVADETAKTLEPAPILQLLFLNTFDQYPFPMMHEENLAGFLRNDRGCQHVLALRFRKSPLRDGDFLQVADAVHRFGLLAYREEVLLPWLKASMRRAVAELPESQPVDELINYYFYVQGTPVEPWAEEHFKPYLARRIRECFHATQASPFGADFFIHNGTIVDALTRLGWECEFHGEIQRTIERLLFAAANDQDRFSSLLTAFQWVEFFGFSDDWKELVRTKALEEIHESCRLPLNATRFSQAVNLAEAMEMQGWRDRLLAPALRIGLFSGSLKPGTEDAQALLCLAMQFEEIDGLDLLLLNHVSTSIAQKGYGERLADLVSQIQNRGPAWAKIEPQLKKAIRHRIEKPQQEGDRAEALEFLRLVPWQDFLPLVKDLVKKAPPRVPELAPALRFLLQSGDLQREDWWEVAIPVVGQAEVRDYALCLAIANRGWNLKDFYFEDIDFDATFDDSLAKTPRVLIQAENRERALAKFREALKKAGEQRRPRIR